MYLQFGQRIHVRAMYFLGSWNVEIRKLLSDECLFILYIINRRRTILQQHDARQPSICYTLIITFISNHVI